MPFGGLYVPVSKVGISGTREQCWLHVTPDANNNAYDETETMFA